MPASYEFITLRPSNVKFVSERTGMSITELKKILKKNAARGIYEVKLPIGVKLFTTEGR